MKSILVTPGKKNSVRLEDTEEPATPEGYALLRPIRVGFDRTDLDINDGLYGKPPPGSDSLVVAHECLAQIVKINGTCYDLQVGDYVVPTVRRPDDCANCNVGESDMCITGNYKEHGIKELNGFASELAISDFVFLVKVPDDLLDVAVLLEPMSVAEKGIIQAFKIQQRMTWRPSRALVLGAGPLGILTTFLLRVKGLEVYTVATRGKDSLKAKLVEESGATYINAGEEPLQKLGMFDLILEDTGVVEVAAQGLGLLRPNGVMCTLGIYKAEDITIDIGSILTGMVLENKLVFGSVNANKSYFEAGLNDFRLVQERYPGLLIKMITTRLKPGDFKKAYQPSREDVKTVVEFS
jgi:threonine dehydrogenase-like Zn-dependent dehydrogenase